MINYGLIVGPLLVWSPNSQCRQRSERRQLLLSVSFRQGAKAVGKIIIDGISNNRWKTSGVEQHPTNCKQIAISTNQATSLTSFDRDFVKREPFPGSKSESFKVETIAKWLHQNCIPFTPNLGR
jgi:hypothetical protein